GGLPKIRCLTKFFDSALHPVTAGGGTWAGRREDEAHRAIGRRRRVCRHLCLRIAGSAGRSRAGGIGSGKRRQRGTVCRRNGAGRICRPRRRCGFWRIGGGCGCRRIGGRCGRARARQWRRERGGQGGTAGGPVLALPLLVTSALGAYWQTDGQLQEASSEAAEVTIEDGTLAQLWQGFGGTFSERAGDYFSQLSAADRAWALQLLFGRDGLRFGYGRIPIGASDYAIDRYSLDETAGDFEMSQFSVERDKQKLIPYIQAVLGVAPHIHLWASPWSPPTWMKENAAFDGGNMKEDDATLH